jgi:hypothetical protein
VVQLDPGHPEFSTGGLQLLGPDRRQVTRTAVQGGGLAVGKADQAGSGVARDQLRQHGTEAERFIVGVGDHGQHAGDPAEKAVLAAQNHAARLLLRIIPPGVSVG